MSPAMFSYTRTRIFVTPSSAEAAWPAAPCATGASNLIISWFMSTSTFGSPAMGMSSNVNTPCAFALTATSIHPPNSSALPFISSTSSLVRFSRERVAARGECVAQARADGVRDMSFRNARALLQVAHRGLQVLRRRGDARVDGLRSEPEPDRDGDGDGRGARERRHEIRAPR